MIFPTRSPGFQIRPAMGHHPGAYAFGKASRHMGYAGGARTLGDFSSTTMSAGLAAGIAQSDLTLLDSVGATDNDIADLINGSITLTALYAEYGVTIPPTTSAAAQTAITSSPGQVPPGSTLIYTASWTAGIGNLSVSPNAAISSLGSLLSAHGMSVVSGQATSSGPVNYAIQVTVLDTIGNALQSDAQSVLDAMMQQVVGNNLSGTSLSIVSIGPSSVSTGIASSTAAATLASDPVTWLENNAVYIAVGVAAFFILNNFAGKKR
jgi:hypothetical protein